MKTIRSVAEGLVWGLAAFLVIQMADDLSMIASWFMP